MLETAIAAGGQIIGGLLGRNKQTKPGDVIRHTMAGIMGQARGAREAAEAYGFNPVTLLGVSSPISPVPVDNSMMGQAFANAALSVADGMSKASEAAAYREKLEEQNAELRKALDTALLRPKVPGIFGTATPSVAAAGNAEVPGSVPAVQSTMTVFSSPGSDATTEVRQGADVEDIATGVAIDGINKAKADGRIPRNWESPFYEAGAELAAKAVDLFDAVHRRWYYGVRGQQEFPFQGNHLVPKDWSKDQFPPTDVYVDPWGFRF